MLMENYTFGGVDNADGINTSNGGWNASGKKLPSSNIVAPSSFGADLPLIK